jgi:hypothetical protein
MASKQLEIVTLPIGLWGAIKNTLKAIPVTSYGNVKTGEVFEFLQTLDEARVQKIEETMPEAQE